MKKIFLSIFFIFIWGCFMEAFCQPEIDCNCSIKIEPAGDCCHEILIKFEPASLCEGLDYRTVEVNTGYHQNIIGQIINAGSALNNISVNINATLDEAIFTSSTNLVTSESLGAYMGIGTFCLANPANSHRIITPRTTLSGPVTTVLSCRVHTEIFTECDYTPPSLFPKIYGDMANNRPSRIKTFDDGLYIVGTKEINGLPYTTFSKFDITNGTVVWEKELDIATVISDFEHNPLTDEFLLVGRTDPIFSGGVILDNQSVILKIDDTGNLVDKKLFNQTGRENFQRILKHKAPLNPNFPFYILGQKSIALNSTHDITVLVNIDENFNTNWIRHYDYFDPSGAVSELENHRGMLDVTDGHLLLIGNGTANNDGVLVKVSGSNGGFVRGKFYQDDFPNPKIDFYDAVELLDGNIALVGTNFGPDEALIVIVGPMDFNHITNVQLPDVIDFKEMGIDVNGNIYTVGLSKSIFPDNHIVHKIKYNIANPNITPTIEYERYINTSAMGLSNPHISVTPVHDRIFFADARLYQGGNFGGYDILLGSFDLEYSSTCTEDFPGHYFNMLISNQDIDSITVFSNDEIADTLNCEFLPPGYNCNFSCDSITCSAAFTWSSDCFMVQLQGNATGSPPFIFEWDIKCDGSVDVTGQSPVWNFLTNGSYPVCLSVIDATGCTASFQDTIMVQDDQPPGMLCPTDLTVGTDPGECFATVTIPYGTPDNCDPNPALNCQSVHVLNLGIHTITCSATDQSGNISVECTTEVTVVDNEPPVINCPPAINETVPACEGGAFILVTTPPASDNCSVASVDCINISSNSFYLCGTTNVICTAIDDHGNESQCTTPVTVNCECGAVASNSLECSAEDDKYDFTILVNNLTGAVDTDCNVQLSTDQNMVSIDQSTVNVVWNNGQATITGTACTVIPPIPNTITINVHLTCNCSNEEVECTLPTVLETPCCKEVFIENVEVCKNSSLLQLPLVNCSSLPDVQQVRWYVADAPCPPTDWGRPFQITNSCDPLVLEPIFHTNDICVYAEVFLGSAAGPCRMLTSNEATITLCEPIGCSLSGQEYCYLGNAITPAPLIISLNPDDPDCTYEIQWFDANGPIVGETGVTYQPPSLTFTAPQTECWQDYIYRAEITSPCGIESCSATIRLYNDDAPLGTLVMDPLEPHPFCPGEDARLTYTPECAGTPSKWEWSFSSTSTGNVLLPGNGDMNSEYITNRLYEDTHFFVEKTNGVCQSDFLDLLIIVNDPLSITNFSASHDPICDPSGVAMQVDFMPDYSVVGGNCDYTISWYKDGNLIQSVVQNSSPVTYIHSAPSDEIAGNYYVVIQDNCCPEQSQKSEVVQVAPPMEVILTGPCFRCKEDLVTLTGVVLNPPAGTNCIYQWLDNGNIILNESSPSIVIPPHLFGPFELNISCGSCNKSAFFDLKQCGNNPDVGVDDHINLIEAKLFPNPTSRELNIEFSAPIKPNTSLELFDTNGKEIMMNKIGNGALNHSFGVSHLPSGIYFIKIMENGLPIWIENFVKG